MTVSCRPMRAQHDLHLPNGRTSKHNDSSDLLGHTQCPGALRPPSRPDQTLSSRFPASFSLFLPTIHALTRVGTDLTYAGVDLICVGNILISSRKLHLGSWPVYINCRSSASIPSRREDQIQTYTGRNSHGAKASQKHSRPFPPHAVHKFTSNHRPRGPG